MPTSSKTGACYTCLIGATVLDEVRAISGLPSRLKLSNYVTLQKFLDFKWPQRILGSSYCFEACCEGL